MIFIFDLDHTLIDSSHRQLTREDGTLDLDHWRENCTPEKIMADRILPLGRAYAEWRQQPRAPRIMQIACTARVMSDPDYRFLNYHGLHFDTILSRPADCTDGDVILKEKLLRQFALTIKMPYARMLSIASFWDDNEKIREHFTQHGVKCYNPIKYNQLRKTA